MKLETHVDLTVNNGGEVHPHILFEGTDPFILIRPSARIEEDGTHILEYRVVSSLMDSGEEDFLLTTLEDVAKTIQEGNETDA